MTEALALSPTAVRAAADQTWPAFALVAGLLLVGVVAHVDGLFSRLAATAATARATRSSF